MALRVLVTRPQPAADRTAKALRAMGFEAVVLPLTEVVAVSVDLTAIPKNFDAAAVTSANALRFAPYALIDRLKGKKLYAVGDATAVLARRLGLSPVPDAPGTAKRLAALMAEEMPSRCIVMYPCGRVRLDDFESAMTRVGFDVRSVETYDTVDRDPAEDTLRDLVALPPNAVLLYSPNAAGRISGLIARPHLRDAFAETVLCCLSKRVAAALPSWTGPNQRIAARPDDAALLDLLNRG